MAGAAPQQQPGAPVLPPAAELSVEHAATTSGQPLGDPAFDAVTASVGGLVLRPTGDGPVSRPALGSGRVGVAGLVAPVALLALLLGTATRSGADSPYRVLGSTGRAATHRPCSCCERASQAPATVAYHGVQFVSAWSEGGSTSLVVEVDHRPGRGTTVRTGATTQNPAADTFLPADGTEPSVLGVGHGTAAAGPQLHDRAGRSGLGVRPPGRPGRGTLARLRPAGRAVLARRRHRPGAPARGLRRARPYDEGQRVRRDRRGQAVADRAAPAAGDAACLVDHGGLLRPGHHGDQGLALPR